MAPKKKMNVLITAGGTREHIDPVRFLSNASSGRMGFALARAALRAGHRVTLVTAPTALKPPAQARMIPVISSNDMFQAVKTEFARCDCLIMAAAVADYTPLKKARKKLKKGDDLLTLSLKPTADILAWAGRHKKKGQMLVGFALEDKNLRTNAERKLKNKNLDLIIANTPAAIAAERSTIHLKAKEGPWQTFSNTPKSRLAAHIIKTIDRLRQSC